MLERWLAMGLAERSWFIFSIFMAVASFCLIIFMIVKYNSDMKQWKQHEKENEESWQEFVKYLRTL